MEESDLLEDVDHGAGSNPNLSTTPSIVFMEAPISRVQQPLSMRNLAGFGCLSKQALIQLIDSLDFTEIHLPQKFFASESIAETPALMEAVGSALAEVVGQSPPTTVSPPRQLLSSNTYDTLPQTPTPRRQHIPELQAEGEDDDTEHTFARLSLIEPRVIEYKGSVRSYTTTSLVEDDGRFVPSPPPSKRKFLEEEAKKALRDPERSASGFMRSFTTVARADNDERFVPAPPQSKRNFFERAAKKETTYRDPYISRLNVATTPSCGLQYLDVRATFEPLERDGPFEATNVRSMAMYDTGAESCVVCDDVLGLSLRSGERMFVLACVDILGTGLDIYCTAMVMPRGDLPNGGADVDIILGQRWMIDCLSIRCAPTIRSQPSRPYDWGTITIISYTDPETGELRFPRTHPNIPSTVPDTGLWTEKWTGRFGDSVKLGNTFVRENTPSQLYPTT